MSLHFDLCRGANYLASLDLYLPIFFHFLSIHSLFVEEGSIRVPKFQPKTTRFKPPQIFLLSAKIEYLRGDVFFFNLEFFPSYYSALLFHGICLLFLSLGVGNSF